MMQNLEKARNDLLEIYQAALSQVNGRAAVSDYLAANPLPGKWSVVAIGKAAQAMAQGALDHFGDRLLNGLVISKYGHIDPHWLSTTPFEGVESAHPVPDDRSLAAGNRLMTFIAGLPEDHRLLFLISGGASSLVEVLPDGVNLDDLQQLNRWMLANGLSIDKMNRLRKRVSMIKGGGLLGYLGNREVKALLISDVPNDDPAVIGSGLLVNEDNGLTADETAVYPEWLQRVLTLAENSKPRVEKTVEQVIVANLRMAREAAARAAELRGYKVTCSHAMICGDAVNVARRMALEVSDSLPGIFIWGGETTVMLPETPGRGGRNQHMALAAAMILAGSDDTCFLAAGTDGTDGPGEDGGAIVDGATLARGRREGLDADDCLLRADSGAFLEASGDLISTGPTGTNVMDLMIGMKL